MKLFNTIFLVALFSMLSACDGTAENTGEKIDETYNESKEFIIDTGDKIEDKADEITDKMKEPFQDPIEEAMEQVKDGIDEAKE